MAFEEENPWRFRNGKLLVAKQVLPLSPECMGSSFGVISFNVYLAYLEHLTHALGVICGPSQQCCLDLLIFGVTVKLLFGHTHIGLALFYGKCIAGCCRSDIQFT